MLRPVAAHSCFFSSSDGYGWSACRWSQSLRKSVVGLGSLPRFFCGRSTRLLAGATGDGFGDGDGFEPEAIEAHSSLIVSAVADWA